MKKIFVLFLSLLLVCCFAVAEETMTDEEIRELAIKNAKLVKESQKFCDNLTFAEEFWLVERNVGDPVMIINYELEDITGSKYRDSSIFLGEIYIDTLYGLVSALDYYTDISDFSNRKSTVLGDYMMYTLAYNCLSSLEQGNYKVIPVSEIAEEIGVE